MIGNLGSIIKLAIFDTELISAEYPDFNYPSKKQIENGIIGDVVIDETDTFSINKYCAMRIIFDYETSGLVVTQKKTSITNGYAIKVSGKIAGIDSNKLDFFAELENKRFIAIFAMPIF